MGLFDKVTDAISGEGSESDNNGDSTNNAVQAMRQGKVDVDAHSKIIAAHYEDVTTSEAREVATILKQSIEESNGKRDREVINTIEEEVGLHRDLADRIFRNERAAVTNTERVTKYRRQSDADDHEFYLPGELDDRAHPVRVEVVEEIEKRGGSVPLDVLQELLREAAAKYQHEGGTPERVDHWLAHEKPRYAITRKVDT